MIKRFLWWMVPFFFLFGCAGLKGPDIHITLCRISVQLDYHASHAADIPENQPLPAKDALKIWAGDRNIIAKRADDYNDLVSFVKKEC